MTKSQKFKLCALEDSVFDLYKSNSDRLPFHGWNHINFVRNKAEFFARELKANIFVVIASALTHDLNYIVLTNSKPETGRKLRESILNELEFSEEEIKWIELTIVEAHLGYRSDKISREGMALSDADTLFKALPITPIIYAIKYLEENGMALRELAEKVVSEQAPLMRQGIYFYSPSAQAKYLNWAKTNLTLWENVLDALHDQEINDLMI